MHRPHSHVAWRAGLALCLALTSCSKAPDSTAEAPAPPAPSNRIELSAEVISNLGVTFARARSGRLAEVIDVPGRLHAAPAGRQVVRAPHAGAVRLAVLPFEQVAKGRVLAELAASDAEPLQAGLLRAEALLLRGRAALEIARAEAAATSELAAALREAAHASAPQAEAAARLLAAARDLQTAAEARFAVMEDLQGPGAVTARERIAARRDLFDAVAAVADAEQHQVAIRLERAERERAAARAAAEVTAAAERRDAAEHEVAAAEAELDDRVRALAAITGMAAADLRAGRAGAEGPRVPDWSALPLAAARDGTITAVFAASGDWLPAGAPILELLDVAELWFEGRVAPSELRRLTPGLTLRIRTASGAPFPGILAGTAPSLDSATELAIVRARVDNSSRVLMEGTPATAEIAVAEAAAEEVLAPAECVVADGLERLVFRRDPAAPAVVIRTPVSIGKRAGGEIEIFAGVGAGDELVRDGVRQLAQIRPGQSSTRGHFHADGTWHEGDG